MFLQREPLQKLEGGFGRPVESIMRCEDFKSNFARKLSNRYVSRTPAKQDTVPKARAENEKAKNVPERIEPYPQLSKSSIKRHAEPVTPFDMKMSRNSEMRRIEVTALNMEVDTLKWQLAQTEANRQMHIALIKQIVTFLNRVKEHIGGQTNDLMKKAENLTAKLLPMTHTTNLPRSRSVLHINKNVDFSPNTPKKINTRKISKSISNVNGYKDCSGIWNQSKISLESKTETSQKIGEEISRLITLANTVLSTKLPDLACSCNVKVNDAIPNNVNLCNDKSLSQNDTTAFLSRIDEDSSDKFIVNAICDKTNILEVKSASYEEMSDKSFNYIHGPLPSLDCKLDHEFASMKLDEQPVLNNKNSEDLNEKSVLMKKNNNFIEDESGFSSMSSFQDIGIPLISIIPPSPSKEVDFMDEFPDIPNEHASWKTDTIELEKQTMKVFWV